MHLKAECQQFFPYFSKKIKKLKNTQNITCVKLVAMLKYNMILKIALAYANKKFYFLVSQNTH